MKASLAHTLGRLAGSILILEIIALVRFRFQRDPSVFAEYLLIGLTLHAVLFAYEMIRSRRRRGAER